MRNGIKRHQWRMLLAAATTTFMVAGAGVAAGQLTPAAADVAPLAASSGCGKAPGLADGYRTIQSRGNNREYILRIPGNYDSSRPYRLIFAFHWRGGTARDIDEGGTSGYPWTYYGLRALANNSTIFVAPQGLGNGWGNGGGEDLTFVDDMITQIESNLCVDPTQKFAMGFSFGGGMTYAIACARAKVFRAVAVYAGAQISGCDGGNDPIAYIGIHGTRDGVLPISNGRSLRDRFVRNNGCTAQNPPEPPSGSLTHSVTHYSGCRAGYPVIWAPWDGGHAPNAVDGTDDPYAPGERSWTRPLVWDFFTQFSGTTPPTTTPPTPGPAGFALRSESSGRCLDVNGANSANGSQMIIWDCHGGTNQRFTQNGRALQVMGKCLEAPNNAGNGTRAQILDCNGGANQQWTLNSNGTITNAQTGLCLDVYGEATANSSAVVVWSCNGGTNQRWVPLVA